MSITENLEDPKRDVPFAKCQPQKIMAEPSPRVDDEINRLEKEFLDHKDVDAKPLIDHSKTMMIMKDHLVTFLRRCKPFCI